MSLKFFVNHKATTWEWFTFLWQFSWYNLKRRWGFVILFPSHPSSSFSAVVWLVISLWDGASATIMPTLYFLVSHNSPLRLGPCPSPLQNHLSWPPDPGRFEQTLLFHLGFLSSEVPTLLYKSGCFLCSILILDFGSRKNCFLFSILALSGFLLPCSDISCTFIEASLAPASRTSNFTQPCCPFCLEKHTPCLGVKALAALQRSLVCSPVCVH